MNWLTIAQLIVVYGIPTAEKLVLLWLNNEPVTAERFAELRDLAGQTAKDRMTAALVRAGVPLDSDQARALLALTA